MVEIAQHSTLPDQAQLADLVDTILTTAKQHGASSAAAAVSFSQGLSVTARLREVEKLQHHRNRSLGVTVYFGQRKGSANTSDWGEQAIADTVQAACDIARYTAADNCAGLADSDRLAKTIPELDLYHPWALEPEAAIELAQQCESAALDFDQRIKNSEGASIGSGSSFTFYGNSHGFSAGYPTSRHSISCGVIGQNDSGMQRDHWYSTSRENTNLESAQAVGKRAAERAIARLDSRQLTTQTAPVLFVPELARGLFSHFISAISGGALYRKASFLLDQIGKQIFPAYVTIHERPHLAKALASAPFDGEGVATQSREIINQGILQGYVLDSYAARRLGLQTTGNSGGIHNLIVESGELGFEQLLQTLQKGLVVTHLMGQGVNIVTGDYSRGASGFWVEDGEIQYPVEEITIAGKLPTMFNNILHIGNDIDKRGAIQCGSVLIEAMTIAGK